MVASRFCRWFLLILLLDLVMSSSLYAQTKKYKFKEIPTLGGTGPAASSEARAVNNHRQVVGTATAKDNHSYAFLYSGGVMRNLGTIGTTGYYAASQGNGINDAGQVVGGFTFQPGQGHAFLYSKGVMRDLGTFVSGTSSSASAINNFGQITGLATTVNNSYGHAFLWDGGGLTDLKTLGGLDSYGTAINDLGQVAGYSYLRAGVPWISNETDGFLSTGGGMIRLGLSSNTGTAYYSARVYGINNRGQITGCANLSDKRYEHAFIYNSDGTVVDLAPSEQGYTSCGYGINNSGQVVGNNRNGAFLYTPGKGMVDLNDLVDNATLTLTPC